MQVRIQEASLANLWQAVTLQHVGHIAINIPEDRLLLVPEV
jgi:hypothetical protein